MDRISNLLNAAATAISDAQGAALARQAAMTPSASAAILGLGQNEGLTLSDLAPIIGISHSATVRLVDSLAHRGLVQRGTGRDRREVALSLTPEGRAAYASLRCGQELVLTPLLATLTQDERDVLETALTRILTGLTLGRDSADHICRFCDEEVCGQKDCPVERQARALSRA